MTEQTGRHARISGGYQLFMLVLSAYAIGAIAVTSTAQLDPDVKEILHYADYLVCAIFFIDFLFTLWRAPNRVRYFLTWGWIDLLSSIPMLDGARWARLARIARVLRVLRMLRATRIIGGTIMKKRAENAFLAASLSAILLIVFTSIAMLEVETEPQSNIKTAEEAIWWAVTTVTTVGYGDFYPVTTEGRMIAALLMFAGVALFTTFSGYFAAWFSAPDSHHVNPELERLRSEITALRAAIDRLSPAKESSEPPPES